MGLLHTGILNSLSDIKIVAITEKEKIITRYIKNLLPGINIYEDAEKMFQYEDLDIVYITTPISLHFPVTLLCIENKINFFVEKPLTKNFVESQMLCQELKNSNLIHSVGYNHRFMVTFCKAKSLLDMKILGDISYVKTSMYVSNILSRPTGWRSKRSLSGGGVLLEFGCHAIDILTWYFTPISRVVGKISSNYSLEVEDFAHMNIEFEGGLKGQLDTSWSVEGYRMHELNVEIMGSNGKLRVNEDFIKVELKDPLPYFKDKDTIIYKQSMNDEVPIDLGGPDYTKENVHMIECVLNEKQTFVNVFEASKTQSVIQAMYDSAREQGIKRVEYFGQC